MKKLNTESVHCFKYLELWDSMIVIHIDRAGQSIHSLGCIAIPLDSDELVLHIDVHVA